MKPWATPWLLAVGLVAALPGCGATDASEQAILPVFEACFVTANDDNYSVVLEVASEDRERQRGLMGRTELGDDTGMLFTYRGERSARHGFWMFQTLIPLDIAYLDDNGVIVSIRTMAPCPSPRGRDCPNYPSGQPFWNAVEMNAGYFEAQGISVGDRLLWPADHTCTN
ncbi:DUF192 domain-containing protein [Marinobacter halophilus]|uniref:DUF192 domain-containing protein n=1 Tax=Marinobacter halophilus TaxID=1323740 RepID=A0A2T1K872_9GAMM|nr:DUF192 domain-containing protein [Marinobacter halophilus]PSF06317.1 DUF192 domain-containing protein [Marinobacter halophilus]GGC71551.1 hypothetical protein GCM10011362_20070 [Marinobacter halophilus]